MRDRVRKLLWAAVMPFAWLVGIVGIVICVFFFKVAILDRQTRELQDAATIEKRLPPGCKVIDLGQYGNVQKVIAIMCDDRKTETMNYTERTIGRVPVARGRVVVTIGGKDG